MGSRLAKWIAHTVRATDVWSKHWKAMREFHAIRNKLAQYFRRDDELFTFVFPYFLFIYFLRYFFLCNSLSFFLLCLSFANIFDLILYFFIFDFSCFILYFICVK